MPHQIDRRKTLQILGAAALLAPVSGVAYADVADIVIGELEKRIMRDYYERRLREWEESEQGRDYKKNKKKPKNLPPGLAKRETLPPGLAMQLQRNGHLPPGLEYRDLPNDLLSQLPHLDPAYRYVIVDNKVVLIKRATNLILDVLEVAAAEIFD
jgi:hypothetical protein